MTRLASWLELDQKGLILSHTFILNLPVLDEHATGQLGLLVDALVHHYPEQPCKYYTKKHKPPFKPKIHLPGKPHLHQILNASHEPHHQ